MKLVVEPPDEGIEIEVYFTIEIYIPSSGDLADWTISKNGPDI